MGILKPWLADHKEEIESSPTISQEQVRIKLGLQKLERGAFDFDVAKGKYISRAEAGQILKQIGQHQRAVLQRKLESELPPKLIGLGVIEVGQMMRETVNEICRILHDRTQQWETT